MEDDGGPPSKEKMDRMNAKMEQKRNIPLAYITLARLYIKQGQYEKGLDAVNKGIDLSPSEFDMYEMRGTIKAKLGDLSGGLDDLNKSLKLNPNSPSAIYLERGIIYLMMGDKASSQKDFDKYLEAFPNGKTYLEKRIKEANTEISETSVGVAACDDYLFKVRRCLLKNVPRAGYDVFENSIQTALPTWKSAASTTEGRASLAESCSNALESLKISLSAYNCEW